MFIDTEPKKSPEEEDFMQKERKKIWVIGRGDEIKMAPSIRLVHSTDEQQISHREIRFLSWRLRNASGKCTELPGKKRVSMS